MNVKAAWKEYEGSLAVLLHRSEPLWSRFRYFFKAGYTAGHSIGYLKGYKKGIERKNAQ